MTEFTRWPPRMQRLIPYLVCPRCARGLQESSEEFRCGNCGRGYPVRHGKIYFVDSTAAEDALDLLKGRLKRLLGPRYYYLGVTIFGPSYPFDFRRAVFAQVPRRGAVVIDLGCGNNRIDEGIVALDAADYGAVDIVADLGALPFKKESIDVFCTRSVLEHVPDLPGAVRQIEQCTRPGGVGVHFIPFMFPFHASPHDYTRLTHAGAKRLFDGWEVLEQRSTAGPITLFLVCFIEFISTLLSFGRERVKAPIYLLLCLLLFPLKFLDAPFVGRRAFLGLAPTILTAVRKPAKGGA